MTKNTLFVSGTATDKGFGDNGVSSVTVNGARANGDTASGIGTANWSATITLTPGVNTISVIARDASPNQNQTTRVISVSYQASADATPPSLVINSPLQGEATTRNIVTVSGTATDKGSGDNGVSSVTVNGTRADGDAVSGTGVANWSRTISLNPGANTISVVARDGSANQNATTRTVAITFNAVATVSAASYLGPTVASESIVAAFGSNLATATQAATAIPLPTTLAGTTVRVKDSMGNERPAPLFFVAPSQINYLIPSGTASGAAAITITSGSGAISNGNVQVSSTFPGLFSANANGQGVASAIALRVRQDGSQSFEPVSRFDQGQGRFVAVPIDLGPATDQVFLLLFGTGWRLNSGLPTVTLKIGGVDAQVLYAGPQGDFVGLDQINARVSRNLAGRGEVDISLTVDGRAANTVRISFR